VERINVVLVGPNNLFRQGLRRLLDSSQFSLAGEARDLAELAASLEEDGLAPDLVVAELNGCQEAEIDILRALRAAHQDLRIVVLANELSLPDMSRLLRAGADGYLVNELSAEAFSLSLLLVMKGEKVLPSTLASRLAGECHSGNGALIKAQKHLTEREKQILQCLLNAYSNKHIARALNISEGTVKVHLKSLMKKIAAGNRTQAALWARNNGIDSGHIMAG
jgi:two-component system, NarL family, nitrate/nitrite response regulator NarL